MGGGHSLHKKDWLKLGGLLALTATGAGAAGVGPMAGLFGAAAPGAIGAGAGAVGAGAELAAGGLTGMGGGTAAMFGPTAAGNGLLALGAESAAPTLAAMGEGATAPMGLPALAQSATAYQAGPLSGLLGGGDMAKAGKFLDIAGKFAQPTQQAQMAPGRPPQPGPQAAPSRPIYGGKPITPDIQAKLDSLPADERKKMLEFLQMQGYAS